MKSSTDYFHELNTDCVGTALGFIAHQYRSFPSQYYGFYPEDWNVDGGGAAEKTAPTHVLTGGYRSARFLDHSYLHFGARDFTTRDTPISCALPSGPADCRERVAVRIARNVPVSPTVTDGARIYRMTIRYRTAVADGTRLRVRFGDSGGNYFYRYFLMNGGASEWQEGHIDISLGETPLSNVNVLIYTVLADNARDFVDIDGVEFLDTTTGEHLITPEAGSFSNTSHHRTHPGDWPATVIDRLGGIASWGSHSHFFTNGHALPSSNNIFGALYTGRTLGESLVQRTALSADIYGDPLFSPAAANVQFGARANVGYLPSDVDTLWRFYGDDYQQDPGRFSARNGDNSSWRLEFCESHDHLACRGNWTTLQAGIGAVDNKALPWSLLPTDHHYDGMVRVATWNPETIDRPIYGYAYLRFNPEPHDDCRGDFNSDGKVDWQDRNDYDGSICEPWIEPYDVDQNGKFTINDIIEIGYLPAGDPLRDPDGDGLEYTTEDQMLFIEWLCNFPYTLFDELDMSGDGVINDDDRALFEFRTGPCH